MNTRSSRKYRRVGIACDNCRRKKTRCPGQRPRCSTCARLDQRCDYEGGENDAEQPSNEDVISRLRQLETQLNTLNDRFELRPTLEATPSSVGTRTSLPGLARQTTPLLTIQPASIRKAFDIYFERIHRQPLWLFEANLSPSPEASEELTYAILALSLSYSVSDLNDANLKSSQFYYDNARRRIMLQVAEGASNLQSIKVLCLLSFFNVISGDLPLAGLNISFAQNLLQYATTTRDTSRGVSDLEERSMIFWSLSLLKSFYGSPILIPVLADGIKTSCFSTVESRSGKTPCPPAPLEAQESKLVGVWAYSARLGGLWGDIRIFISRCMEGSTEAPWNLNSDYHALYSRSLDLEVTHRTGLSYNNVGFTDRPAAEIHADRLDWHPWLRMQVTYHAIHCVLNHPFLYSSKASRQKFGKTTFWRESSEKALRHCNWVSRLLRLPREKGLRLDDPFFAQAAGIAATLNLYWARVNDAGVRTKALENLEICQTVISEMASYLPVCGTIEQSLNRFKNFVSPSSNQVDRLGSIKKKPTTSLKWLLLDIASSQFPNYPNEIQCSATDDGHDEMMLNSSDIGTPGTRIRESTGHYASPPEWMSSQTEQTPVSGTRPHLSIAHEEEFHQSFNRMMGGGQYDQTDFNLAWGPWGQIGDIGDSFGPGLEWWDFTTL